MKLQAARVAAFVRSPDPEVGSFLVYGPDGGLVRERAEMLLKDVVEDINDPFAAADIEADLLRREPGRLIDEAQSLSLMGGGRIVRVRQATDIVTPACKLLFEVPMPAARVVVEAGELSPRSSLRLAFEQARNAAALPCYREEGDHLKQSVRQMLSQHRLRAEPDALTYLGDHLGADRDIMRSELAKLAVYLGEEARVVRLEDAAAVVGDSSALAVDDVIHAAALGDQAEVERGLERLLGEGRPPPSLLRAFVNHWMRLRHLRARLDKGINAQRCVEQARPPVHYRARSKVVTQLTMWTSGACQVVLSDLFEADALCRSTGMPAATILRATAMSIAARAQRLRRRS